MKIIPYVKNKGISVRYEVEGNGPPLVLLQGLTGYLELWHELGYVNSLRKDYKLILIDIRGHGGSDKPRDPEAYKLKSLVTDVVEVMDDLDVRKAHFMGYSLGGRIGFALAKYVPKRFHSFIIGGANIDEFSQDSVQWWLQLLKKGMDAVIEMFEKWGMEMTPQIRAKLLANDTEALAAFMLSSEWRASLEYALPNMTMPCLIFVGEADPNCAGARECAKCMHNAEFISFPNLGHLEVISQSHLVLPHITKFLAKTTQS